MQPIERNGLISLLFLLCAGSVYYFSEPPTQAQARPKNPSEALKDRSASVPQSKGLQQLPSVDSKARGKSAGGSAGGPSSAGLASGAGKGAPGPSNPGQAAADEAARRAADRIAYLAAQDSAAQGAEQEGPAAGSPPSAFASLPPESKPIVVGGQGRLDATPRTTGGLGGLGDSPVRQGLEVQPAARRDAPTFERYTVKSGDSMGVIAQRLLGSAKCVDLFKQANPGLDIDRIFVGQVLNVPSSDMVLAAAAAAKQASTPAGAAAPTLVSPGGSSAKGATNNTNGNTEVAVAVAVAASGASHVVQEGESLWKIAESRLGNGMLYKQIAELNPGIDLDHLTVGTQLRLPSGGQGGGVGAEVVQAVAGASKNAASTATVKANQKPKNRVR